MPNNSKAVMESLYSFEAVLAAWSNNLKKPAAKRIADKVHTIISDDVAELIRTAEQREIYSDTNGKNR
jgi:hypothetical protein